MRVLASFVACLLAPAIARAEPTPTPASLFAAGMGVEESAVVDVHDYWLKSGDYTRAFVGRFKSGEVIVGGVAMIWCEKQDRCWYAHAWLGAASTVDTLGLIDLAGKPAPFPTQAHDDHWNHDLALPGKPRWPALVVRTTTREQTTTGSRYGGSKTGEHRRVELTVLSLASKDRPLVTVFRSVADERWPTGAGIAVSFALARDSVIVATEHTRIEDVSACLPPKPTTVRYKPDEHRRYQRVLGDLGHAGCGSH